MRTIKFRGKDFHSGEWFYGNLFVKDSHGRTHISTPKCGCFRINPETVGQFTGVIDEEGQEVFEGDILEADYKMTESAPMEVLTLITTVYAMVSLNLTMTRFNGL